MLFACIESDSDSDEDGGHTARYSSGTNIGHMLPAPEIVDDHASCVHSLALTHFGDIISGGCGEIYINRFGEFEETSDVKGILCGFEPIYALAVVYGVDPLFISTHGDGLVRSWNLLSRTPLSCISAHSGPILGLTVLQGAEPVIITGGRDRFVHFYDTNLNLLSELPEQADAVLCLDANMQGESSVLITGAADGAVIMWMYSAPSTHMKIRDISKADCPIRAIAMSSELFAVGKYDGKFNVCFAF
jgi:WD40 repeat protein